VRLGLRRRQVTRLFVDESEMAIAEECVNRQVQGKRSCKGNPSAAIIKAAVPYVQFKAQTAKLAEGFVYFVCFRLPVLGVASW